MDPAASPASFYDEDVLYEVESIKDMRAYEGGQRMFLIKWKNYDDRWYVCRDIVDYGSDPLNTTFIVDENTWEPEENLNCPDLLEQFLAYHTQSRSRKRSPSLSKRRRSTTQPTASQPAKTTVTETLTEKTASNQISAPEPKRVRTEVSTTPVSTKLTVGTDTKKPSASKAVQSKDATITTSSKQQQQPPSVSVSSNIQSQPDVMRTSQLKSTKLPTSMKGDEITTIQPLNSQPSTKHSSLTKRDTMTANEMTKNQPIPTIEHKHPQQQTTQSSKSSIYLNPTRPKTPTPPVSPTFQKTQLPSTRPSNQPSNTAPFPKPSVIPSASAKRSLSRENSPTREERIGSIKRTNRSAPPKHTNPSFLDELVSKVSNQPIPQASYTRTINTSTESSRHGSTSPSLKRQTLPSQPPSRSLRDPRLVQHGQSSSSSSGLQMIPPPTDPLSWHGTIYRLDDVAAEVRLSSITGRCPGKPRIREILKNAKREYNDDKKLVITSFISLSILRRFYENRVPNLVDIQPQSHARYRYNKFHNFLKLNSVAGLIQLDKHKQEVLAVLPLTPDIAALFSLENLNSTNMLLIYLDQMPPQTPLVQKHLDLLQRDQLFQRPRKSFDWHLLTNVLKFPPQLLQRINPFTNVDIYGESRWAESLRHAHRLYASKSNIQRNRERIILFDRHNDSQFKSKNLLKLKRGPRPPTFWEFGSSDISDERILPPAQLFPRYCGGFITTDIRNIMNDPKILERIAKAVKSMNKGSVTGEWSFVLNQDILDQMMSEAKGAASAKKIMTAMAELSIVISGYDLSFVRDWGNQSRLPSDTSDATIQFMEGLVRTHCSRVENFVLVDDIGSMTKNQFAVIDSCKSLDIVEKFSIYPVVAVNDEQS
ncbi:hypothetical protein K492DRAFT_209787 [Lichtheimia hyalospora FSU 10163]|nr:hypothetical protein K492DRAFT_209787 [Lichtheimia hyalospora FSU 10163]